MEILLPITNEQTWEEQVEHLVAVKPLTSFSAESIKFIKSLSTAILRDKTYKQYPELIAMAFWMRESHLLELKKDFLEKRKSKTWVPRGIVLHFAPSNVDSIFMYSWFISLLVGNINMVRLSQKRSEQVNKLLQLIDSLLMQEEHQEMRERTLIMSYEHNDDTTAFLSERSDVRIIWGGDRTVQKIKSIPASPSTHEIVFTDKSSMAVLKAAEIIKLEESYLHHLIHQFYNDAFWFDQMACSSPKIVVWIGQENEISSAKKVFWSACKEYISVKGTNFGEAVGITRMVTGYSYATQGFTKRLLTDKTELPYRIEVKTLNQDIKEQHCGGGMFIELNIEHLRHLTPSITRKDQTLSYFGLTKEELVAFSSELGGTGD